MNPFTSFLEGKKIPPVLHEKPASPARPNLPKDCGRDRVPSELWPGMLRWMGVTGSRQHGPHLKVELFADVWFSMAISGRITASCKNNPCLGKSDDHHQKCCLLVKSHDVLRDFSLRLDYQHPHSVNKLEGSRRWKNQEIKKNGMPSHSSESMAK